jgi:hypothetical protein
VSSRFRAAALLFAFASSVAAPAASQDPRIDFMLHCQGCHLADGSGAPDSVPSLKDSMGRYLLVPGGREYLLRVPGSALSPLSDERLAGVLNWMIRAFGPSGVAADFEPFSAEEVVRYRSSPLTDVEPLRSELLRKIQNLEAAGGAP